MARHNRNTEALSAYIPTDRRQALASGAALPERTRGAALFADISGFTPLTEALVRGLGGARGAEELTRLLNLIYELLIADLHLYGGSVISFGGDALTCWFDGDSGLRATACGLAMQRTMARFASVPTPSGEQVSLAMKVAVAAGPVRRYMVGDPQIQLIDALAGATLDRLATAEHLAARGEVVVCPATIASLGGTAHIAAWRADDETGQQYGVVGDLLCEVPPAPWPPLPPNSLNEEQVRPWLLQPVYERLRSGRGDFLAELRPVVALFLRFGGIDYDRDDAAGPKLDAFIRQVVRILQPYEGSLMQLIIGDKGSYLYAAFGAPTAHEDDATRAASAALELRALALEMDAITDVQIGICQGQLRTGACGGSMRRTYSVLGDEVNTAARLMQAAAPGQILMHENVWRVVADSFVWERLPDMPVKGKAEPVPVYRLDGPQHHRALGLPETAYAVPMIGRQAELEQIGQAMAKALRGRGQVIGITGDAGMGKTRLVAEVMRMASGQRLTCHGGECQSYGTRSSYLVWQSIWRAAFGLDPAMPLEEQVSIVERRLAGIDPALALRAPLLSAVLSLPIPDNDLTRSLDAKLRKASLEALMVDCLRAWSGEEPLLLVLEDCHWIDPLSDDLLEVLARTIPDLPVVLVLAYRPLDGHKLRVSTLPHFQEMRLAEFTSQEAERLIGYKLQNWYGTGAEMPSLLLERVTARAEGNPFYIEELLDYLRDRGLDPYDRKALEQLDLPSSLHSLILSRVDRVSENQKSTLKVASVIGREFRASWLWGYYPTLGDPQQVRADLDVLSSLGLTPLDTPEPDLSYLFKHVVTREAIYESLPHATRGDLHGALGQFLERTYSDALEQHLDLLAYHYERSPNVPKKREYLLKAARAAQRAYANTAAAGYYERVLPLLTEDEQVPAWLSLGQVLELVGRWKDAAELYDRALQEAERLGLGQAAARCRTALGELCRKQGEYAEASAWLQRAQSAFEQLEDRAGVGQALHYQGSVAAQQGDYAAARAFYEESLAIRRELDDRPYIGALLSNLGILARFQGDYAAARALHEEALAMRRQLGDRWAIGVSLCNLGNVALDQGSLDEARTLFQEGLSVRRQVGDRWAIANALNNLGNLARIQGDYEAARSLYEESLTINRALGDGWALAYLLEDIGCLEAVEGRPARALRLMGAAAALRDEIGAPLSPTEKQKLSVRLAPARQALSEASAASALGEGRALSLEEAIEYALRGHGAKGRPAAPQEEVLTMSAAESWSGTTNEESKALLAWMETALQATSLEELEASVLPSVAKLLGAESAFVALTGGDLLSPGFLQHGLVPEAAARVQALCTEHLAAGRTEPEAAPVVVPSALAGADLLLCPLRSETGCVGVLGLQLAGGAAAPSPGTVGRLSRLLAAIIRRLADRAEQERRLSHLNAYLTVSSMLAQSLGLHDLVEMALYSCMDVVSAEAASVLLLDEDKRNFRFYQVEGPAKPALMTATMPADQGLAGSVLQTLESEVINDVASDPRFYGQMDSQSGFRTRNMIAVPLVAGEEKVGVLEVLNKAGGAPFIDEERLLLVSFAEEIAFAVRNALVFEYLAGTYCKQRQGQGSCRGCERPLGSWTPCVRYREATL